MIKIFTFILLFSNGVFFNIKKNIKYKTKLYLKNDDMNVTYDTYDTNLSEIYNKNKYILLKKNNKIKRDKDKLLGYDLRNNTENYKLEGNIKEIKFNFEKLKILNFLINKKNNNIDKINLINENIYLFNNKSNIINGGLYKDWDFEI
jgi:hypothetical protein